MRFARFLGALAFGARSVRIVSIAGLLFACGGGSSARLEIEIAPSPAPGGADGDEACAPASETLPRDVDCVTVTVCERTEDGCAPVPVLQTSEDHGGAGTTELRFSRSDSPSVTFDVRFEADKTYELELLAYRDDGTPYARGLADGLRAGVSSIRVRLEPFGRWACAGPRADGTAPAARALHAAVALPDGDVLVLGGVTGEAVSAVAVESGAALQRTIEVYDASEARFHVVQATDTDGEPGYGAVFHRAFYAGLTDDGRYRVRSVGGFTAMGGDPAARFDAIQGLTSFSSPLLPGGRSERRDTVDVLYDPATRTAEIVAIEPGAVSRAGFDAVSEPDAAGLRVVVLGVENGGGTVLRPVPTLSGRWYALPLDVRGDVTSMPLIAPRFGATASRLSAAQVLVWGGNVDEITAEDVAAHAGELLGGAGGAVPGSLGGLPPATALHSATPIEGGTLIAGGLELAPIAGMSGGMSTTPSSQPLTVISLDATSRPQGTAIAVDGATWPTTILHAATAIDDESVVIAGGAFRMTDGAPSTLWATDAAIRVSRDATGVYSVTPLADLAIARWGLAIAPLSRGRVLVTGGFVREGGTLRAVSSGEVLLLEPAPASISSCRIGGSDGGVRDAGVRRDGSAEDAAVLGEDAAVVPDDAG